MQCHVVSARCPMPMARRFSTSSQAARLVKGSSKAKHVFGLKPKSTRLSYTKQSPVTVAAEPVSTEEERRPDVNRRSLLFTGAGALATAAGIALPCDAVADLETAASGAGKRVIITGSNTGIGKAAATELARRGYSVVLACRNPSKAQSAAEEIVSLTGNAAVTPMTLDLASLASIRDFAGAINAESSPVDILCNNAGIMACPEMATADGFEMQLGVNHLGHFYLTTLLEGALRADGGARVINTSSAAHLIGSIDLEDPFFRSAARPYSKWPAYGQSKLANILFTQEMAKRCAALGSGVTVHAYHPGVVNTELARYLLPESWVEQQKADPAKSARAASLFGLRSPEKGAETMVFLADQPEGGASSGLYWVDNKAVRPGKKAFDAGVQAGLWDLSADLTGANAAAFTA